MGRSYKPTCRACGNHFKADEGGGRRWELLHRPLCGKSKVIGYEEIGELVQKLEEQFDIPDLDEEGMERASAEYHKGVEAFAGFCPCGGHFSYGVPLRCPACRSTDLDLGEPWRLYD